MHVPTWTLHSSSFTICTILIDFVYCNPNLKGQYLETVCLASQNTAPPHNVQWILSRLYLCSLLSHVYVGQFFLQFSSVFLKDLCSSGRRHVTEASTMGQNLGSRHSSSKKRISSAWKQLRCPGSSGARFCVRAAHGREVRGWRAWPTGRFL